MKKFIIIILVFAFISSSAQAIPQDTLSENQTEKLKKGFGKKMFFKKVYEDFFKYGT